MDLEDLVKKAKEQEKQISTNTSTFDDSFWVLIILWLILLDSPKKEEKQPIINVYLGGE